MTTPASSRAEECFNVYGKIKNFSFCCEAIRSPAFSVSGCQYYKELDITSDYGACEVLSKAGHRNRPNFEKRLSILTCDGSPEVSFSSDTLFSKDVIFGARRNAFLPEDTLTVRFRSPTYFDRGELLICSQIKVERKYFLWTFQEFSKYPHIVSISVENSELYGCIGLNLKSMCGNNPTEQLSMEIARTGGERCYCVLKISMVDVDGKAVNEVRDEFVLEESNDQQTRGFPMMIKKRKLLACKNLLPPNDTLTLKCYFAISSGKVTDGTSDISYCENSLLKEAGETSAISYCDKALFKEADELSMSCNKKIDPGCVTELQTHLKSMLDDGTLFDVSLHIGSEVIRAHKNILSARSPVFRAMFTRDTTEAMSNTVVIEDLDVETVRGLLLFMYTDTLHDDQWESMKKVYLASDKYEVLSLKKNASPSYKN
ncbi:hypothetical protein AVEN_145478-1 [Araneus ventricosus]|uniref:BTB domain-containing protein n=1 Tax=Araneus ventricosus TaxID=182803 RepID=A0A4Y2TFI0_ARAVE|nr:hypothetical protein AVEN_145478-1 [Araneus ventricosus]